MANHEHRFGDEGSSSPPDKLPAPDEAGPTDPNPESSQAKRQDHDIKDARLLGGLVTDLATEPPVQTAETGDKFRMARFSPQELDQALTIYDQLEGQDQDLIARRFGFDGHQPHTHKEIGAVFGHGTSWAETRTRRLIANEPVDKQRGGRFKPSELVQAQAIYDQLEGPDRDLIARRFGLDGHDPHTYKEIEAVFGRSEGWAYRQTERLIANEPVDKQRGASLKPSKLVQAQAIYDQLEGPDRDLIARRFGFDGHDPHTYKEIGAMFGYSTNWARRRTRRLIANEPVDKQRGGRFNPSELVQAQAIYDQLEGQDQDLIARRFGLDGHDPHTYKEIGAMFGYSTNWARRRTRRLIANESADKRRGARFKPSELVQAQTIYDQLEGQDQDLIARRFGFDGYQSHTHKEIGAVFGYSTSWAENRTRRLIANEPVDKQRGASLKPSELVQAQTIYDQLEGQDQDLIARRFGFDGYQSHTHKEIGAVFGYSTSWAENRTRRLIANEPVDKQRGGRFNPSELVQAQAIYDQLEGQDQDLIARRFGLDGHDPHTYKEIEAVFGRSEGWAYRQTERLIANEPVDKQRGASLKPSKLVQAQAIYDQLEGPDRDLIARRFGFDGHQPHTIKQLGVALGCEVTTRRIELLLSRQDPRFGQLPGFSLQELAVAKAIIGNLEGPKQELIARRFGLKDYPPHSYRELGAVFGQGTPWARKQVKRIVSGRASDPRQTDHFKPRELAPDQAIRYNLEGQH